VCAEIRNATSKWAVQKNETSRRFRLAEKVAISAEPLDDREVKNEADASHERFSESDEKKNWSGEEESNPSRRGKVKGIKISSRAEGQSKTLNNYMSAAERKIDSVMENGKENSDPKKR